MKCTCCRMLRMCKCACGEHMKHIVCFHHFHAIKIIDAHRGLSNSCILCSQNLWAFIGSFDWNRLPAAEIEYHYLQNGRENKNAECKCIDCVHATDYAYKCITKCLVQTPVARPSWWVHVWNVSLFWLWQGFYNQSPHITNFMFFLYELAIVEKRRSWGVSRIW